MQNLYDRVAEWGPTYFDNKHAFTGSFVYQLPFGQKHKFGSHWNKAVDGILGGWQMGGILTAHTGFPLTIKMSGDPSGTGARSFRANVTGKPNDPHLIGPGLLFLDPTPYSVPTARTFGNVRCVCPRRPRSCWRKLYAIAVSTTCRCHPGRLLPSKWSSPISSFSS